ncbi:DNA polymerase III subunit gamma and tau [Streptacidiphilus sp. MAP12-16]|uniref:DNA polymerase III subunit gamma and tau n=1 Tax=Streptacidiphilus sp. MAP12-16 TaxID=3156300 RepID=UPI00351469A7
MSLALYRRYRPETYAEVIGQEHVTGPLQQALRNNRVNHAYLFSGPRGCGKTTSARILARCLNCEQGPTPTPCGECQSCRDLARGGPGSIDVIEIDAASHGGVDDTRDLREKAFFAPASSRYKIYIIDEAHMVSTAGFNALLKVVEEPPPHLKFIFATTEPEKVIGTIRSRTHHYPFRLVPPGTLRDYLAEVCGREQIQVEDSVYPLVVRAGAGSVRDSMSVMDQLLAGAADQGVTYAMATALLGYTDAGLLDEVVDAFAAQDGATVFGIVDRVIEGGHDPRRFVADLLERLRDLVILSAVPDAGEKGLIDAPADRVALMERQAAQFGPAELSRAADIVNTGLTEMRGATSPRLQLELICARVMLPGAYDDERSTQARLDKLERRSAFGAGGAAASGGTGAGTSGGGGVAAPQSAAVAEPVAAAAPPTAVRTEPAAAPQVAAAPAQEAQPAPAQASPPRGAWPVPRSFPASGSAATPEQQAVQPPQPPQSTQQMQPVQPVPPVQTPPSPSPAQAAPQGGAGEVRRLWPQILEAVKGRRRVTWMLVQQAQVAGFDGSTLQLSFEHAGTRDGFVNGGHDEILRQALQDALGVSWRIDCLIDPSVGRGPGPGPAAAQAQQQQQPQQQQPGPGLQPGHQAQAPSQVPVQAPSPTQPPPQASAFAPVSPSPVSPPSVPTPSPVTPTPPQATAPTPTTSSVPDLSPPPPFWPDDDVPEEEDPVYPHGMVSGPELIMRELGATVIEEIDHDR